MRYSAELLSSLVYGVIESCVFPAEIFLIDSIDKHYAGDEIGELPKST